MSATSSSVASVSSNGEKEVEEHSGSGGSSAGSDESEKEEVLFERTEDPAVDSGDIEMKPVVPKRRPAEKHVETVLVEVKETPEEMLSKMARIVFAVSITMIVVSILVKFLNPDEVSGAGSGGYGGAYGVGEMTDIDSLLSLFGLGTAETLLLLVVGSILNAFLFLILIAVMTFVVLLLYKIHCTKLLWGWLIFSSGILLFIFGGLNVYEVLKLYNLPLDYITAFFVLSNFAAAGLLAIFWRSPRKVNQFYLIVISVLMASSLTKLPEWTTWLILFVFAMWDIFAVLAPFGPLKLLVKTAQKRNESIPGLIYEMGSVAERRDTLDEIKKLETQYEISVRLGLGDFVFYSVLIGRAALFDYSTLFVCFIVVIQGLMTTMMLLAKVKQPLPALPFSILFGMVGYYLTRYMLSPMIYEFGTHLVFA